jgi:hypothetical protein
MSLPAPFRAVCLALALSATLASCGGSTDGGDDSSGGSAGTGAVGGTTGKGGTSTAGTGAGATGAIGGTGAGATGGTGAGAIGGTGAGATGGVGGKPSFCSLPAETGPCEASFERFFHNAKTGICEPFVYGGCEGNENNFETFEECEAACGSKPLDACEDNGDCFLRAKGCCGACDPSQLSDFVALNVEYNDVYAATLNCEVVDCAPCLEPEPGTSNQPYFVATCQANRCIAVDLRTTDVTECNQPSDCSLRFGSGCCESCGGEIIALSDQATLSDLVCPKEIPPCLACEPGDPAGLTADCQSGRCLVAPLSP